MNEIDDKSVISHPKRYNRDGRKECIWEMVDIFGHEFTVIWAIMTAYKYRYRMGMKDAEEQEWGKIRWYEDFVVDRIVHCGNLAKGTWQAYKRAIGE